MATMRKWFGRHQIMGLAIAFSLGAGSAGAVGAAVATQLRSDLTSKTHVTEQAEHQRQDLQRDLERALEETSSLQQRNGELTNQIAVHKKRGEQLKRQVKRLADHVTALSDEASAAPASRVLCDPGGCENPAYSPNPANATYCDAGATFAYEGQCSYGD